MIKKFRLTIEDKIFEIPRGLAEQEKYQGMSVEIDRRIKEIKQHFPDTIADRDYHLALILYEQGGLNEFLIPDDKKNTWARFWMRKKFG